MRIKFFLFFLFLIITSSFVSANIYDFLDSIKHNPGQATIALDDAASAEVVVAVSELAGKIGITKSIFISEITNQQNVIIIQLSNDENAFIKYGNRGISVIGNQAALVEAVDYIKDFDKHKKALSVDNYWFKEKSNILPIFIGLVLIIVIGAVVWHLWKKKKPVEPGKVQMSQEQIQRIQQQYRQQQSPPNQRIISIIFLLLAATGILFITRTSITGYASLYFDVNEEHTIYNLIGNILEDPSNTMIVVGRFTDVDEIEAASELAGFFGIFDSRFDDEVDLEGNQILVGRDNILINELIIWDLNPGEAMVKIIEQDDKVYLIVSGTFPGDTQQAVDIIMDYRLYSDELNKDCVKIVDYLIYDCDEIEDLGENPPTGGGGPSGGGGSRSVSVSEEVEEICTEEWVCDEWSECMEGYQSRDCIDINGCGTEDFIPELERTCEVAEQPVEETPGIVEEIKEEKEQENKIKISILIFAIALVVITGIIILVYQKYFPNKLISKKTVPEEIRPKVIVPDILSEYIKRCLDNGFDEKIIRNALMQRGWKKEVVDGAFDITR